MSSSVKQATTEDLLRANKVLSRAKLEHTVLAFKGMGDLSTVKFVCFNDSYFGNLRDGGSQGGYVIFLEGQNGNCSPLMWQSKKLRRVVKSTVAAETLSQVKAPPACFWLSSMLKEVLLDSQDRSPQYSIECRTDSHQLYDAAYSIRPVLDKRVRIDTALLKEMLERKN